MKIRLLKRFSGLFPVTKQDEEKLARIKQGDIIEATYIKPRNPKHHRKFMALMNIVLDNNEKYENMDDLLFEMKLQTGHVYQHISLGGKITYRPKSISFGSMDQIEFDLFYSKAVNVVLKFFLKGLPEEDRKSVV